MDKENNIIHVSIVFPQVYEDPDSQVQVQPTHGGPLPTPPGQKPPPVPSNKTMPPPRQKHGRLPDLPAPPKQEPEPEEEVQPLLNYLRSKNKSTDHV